MSARLRPRVRSLAASGLSLVRRGREVLWTPDFMKWGNLLSLARDVHDARREGHERWMLLSEPLRPWLAAFPDLGELTLERDRVRFTDQRWMPWSPSDPRHRPADGGFRVEQTFDFLRRRVLDVPLMREARDQSDPGRLVVNVRRGDYFSDPTIRAEFGMDTQAFVAAAVGRTVEQHGAPSSVLVVSDDPRWCREHLTWLADVAPVTTADPSDGPARNFADVAAARRTVLSNSTFSYWAGFASNAWHGDNLSETVVPGFFMRSEGTDRSPGLDPRWSIVDDVPGRKHDPASW